MFAIDQITRIGYRCNSDKHLVKTCYKTKVRNTCKMKACLSGTCRNNNKREFSRMKSTCKSTKKNYYLEGKDDTER